VFVATPPVLKAMAWLERPAGSSTGIFMNWLRSVSTCAEADFHQVAPADSTFTVVEDLATASFAVTCASKEPRTATSWVKRLNPSAETSSGIEWRRRIAGAHETVDLEESHVDLAARRRKQVQLTKNSKKSKVGVDVPKTDVASNGGGEMFLGQSPYRTNSLTSMARPRAAES
jgi:hypothetical protein